MSTGLSQAILELAESAGNEGVAMGAIVDTLEAAGHEVESVEQEIWDLMARRRLTPCGFVCRVVRQRVEGEAVRQRVYELMLVPWSRHLDDQLELELGG